jgi:CheY-like chemotaxis protein
MPAERARVLIVEDSLDTREMYATYFRGQGYVTYTAADGYEALVSTSSCRSR